MLGYESWSWSNIKISYSLRRDVEYFEGEKLFKAILMLVDVNHDQVVDLEEFSAVYPVATSTFFNSLDLNNNKKLEIHEFKQMFLQADGNFLKERHILKINT